MKKILPFVILIVVVFLLSCGLTYGESFFTALFLNAKIGRNVSVFIFFFLIPAVMPLSLLWADDKIRNSIQNRYRDKDGPRFDEDYRDYVERLHCNEKQLQKMIEHKSNKLWLTCVICVGIFTIAFCFFADYYASQSTFVNYQSPYYFHREPDCEYISFRSGTVRVPLKDVLYDRHIRPCRGCYAPSQIENLYEQRVKRYEQYIEEIDSVDR